MSSPHELHALKERIFKEELKMRVKEKKEVLGEGASKKAIAMAIQKDWELEDYAGLYRLISKLDL